MTDIERLADLIRRVPVHVINEAEATAASDVEALWYARDMRTWLSEAENALQGIGGCQDAGGGKSQEVGRERPVVGLPGELVSVREFSPGLAI